jgi:4'-phosphopantetheinyl transferase
MNLGEPIWGGFDRSYVLPLDEVHVWRTTLDLAASDIARLRQMLSVDERERADRFHFDADRRRSVIGRGYLRLLLGRILNLPPSELQFEYDEFGKPGLMPRLEPSLEFNVSHSGDLILIAIAIGRAVGVDVEKIRTDLDPVYVAAHFFSTSECKILASLGGDDQYDAFFACWTRKEAYLKARGIGLSLPLDQFDVSFLPIEAPRLLATRPDPAEAGRWKLQALEVASDHAAALAAAGMDWRPKCWNWPPALLLDCAVRAG